MTPTIHQAVNLLTQQLTDVSDTPRLDAELLIATVLKRPRAWLFAHCEQSIPILQQQQIETLSARRRQDEPMAYILGHKEFWGWTLKVNQDVLIPRPETEHLVEWVLNHFPDNSPLSMADLGTGSGAIALALALERPAWRIHATDHSLRALDIAKQNANTHQASNLHFYLGDWCSALPHQQYSLLISNPPYIAENDVHLQALAYEPLTALTAGADGLNAIRKIIEQAPDYLTGSGYLVLEHGYNQADLVIELLNKKGFHTVQSHRDLANNPRFITAQ